MKDIKILQSETGEYYADFNDIVIENHDMKLIENPEKLLQDIVKFLLILKGGNFLFQNYGTQISEWIGNRNTDKINDKLREQVLYALTYVRKINENEEINLSKIINVKVEPYSNYYKLTLDLLLTNGQTLIIAKQFS